MATCGLKASGRGLATIAAGYAAAKDPLIVCSFLGLSTIANFQSRNALHPTFRAPWPQRPNSLALKSYSHMPMLI